MGKKGLLWGEKKKTWRGGAIGLGGFGEKKKKRVLLLGKEKKKEGEKGVRKKNGYNKKGRGKKGVQPSPP
ncbi:hypothetical protein ACQ1Z4_14425, partial [Enterococcus faecalis]|uniref:hypothetical protein n=1 Tax=Enterococcus faecalis TaxID=1351 RepID=UPI003D6B4074